MPRKGRCIRVDHAGSWAAGVCWVLAMDEAFRLGARGAKDLEGGKVRG